MIHGRVEMRTCLSILKVISRPCMRLQLTIGMRLMAETGDVSYSNLASQFAV